MNYTSGIRIASLVLLSAILPACGGSGSSGTGILESEPNDTPAKATALLLGQYGMGSLGTAADVDYWQFHGTQDAYITIDVAAARFDQAAWDVNSAQAIFTLLAGDGVTPLIGHDAVAWSNSWGGANDLGTLIFKLPATGTYYLKVVSRDSSNAAVNGGNYLIRVATQALLEPVVQEAEGLVSGLNDTPATAESLTTQATTMGWFVDNEDDYYSFNIVGPTVIRIELTTHRNGLVPGQTTYFDPTMALYDTDGVTLLQSNDDGIWYDSVIDYRFTTNGTYYLRLSENSLTGSCPYFLTVTARVAASPPEVEPNNTVGTATLLPEGGLHIGTTSSGDPDYYSFLADAGDVLWVKMWDSVNLQGATGQATVTIYEPDGTTVHPSDLPALPERTYRTMLTTTGTHYIRVLGNVAPTTTYAIETTLVKPGTNAQEQEPNGSAALAGKFYLGRAWGIIQTAGDVDQFAFKASMNEVVKFEIFASSTTPNGGGRNFQGTGSTLQEDMAVQDHAGNILARSRANQNAYPESLITQEASAELFFVAPHSGTFYLAVRDQAGTGSANHWYMVEKK